jgi:O-antigen/teichoic acid export membrane protein
MNHPIPELDAKGLREFALVTGSILAVLFGILLPWLFDLAFPLWPWIVALVLVAWGLVAPSTLGPVYRTWMRFGLLMSKIMTPLVTGLVFFLVITPVAFVMKLIQRDPMARTLKTPQQTYRVMSTKAPRSKMERPY